jgi:hypothetical protein
MTSMAGDHLFGLFYGFMITKATGGGRFLRGAASAQKADFTFLNVKQV